MHNLLHERSNAPFTKEASEASAYGPELTGFVIVFIFPLSQIYFHNLRKNKNKDHNFKPKRKLWNTTFIEVELLTSPMTGG